MQKLLPRPTFLPRPLNPEPRGFQRVLISIVITLGVTLVCAILYGSHG
jgi:hypothetical protein